MPRKRKPSKGRTHGKRHAKRAPSTPQQVDQYVATGIIGIVDVERFSTIPDLHEQVSLVKDIYYSTKRSELVQHAKSTAHINGTGDGLLVAVPFHVDRLQLAIDWAQGLMNDPKIVAAGRKLRFGLHIGEYMVLGGTPRLMAVGRALNECQRVVSIGDGGHIVASNQFVQQYKNLVKWEKISHLFDPSSEEECYIVPTKHGVRTSFRICTIGNKVPPPPQRLRVVQVAREHIHNLLAEIEQAFIHSLQSILRSQDLDDAYQKYKTLDVRVSIFEPEGDLLKCNEFRFHQRGVHTGTSQATYSIAGTGTGVLGKVFCDKKLRVLNRLVERTDKTEAEYDAPHVALGVARESIGKWNRHACGFVAFPFFLAQPNGTLDDRENQMRRPLGVVCVDTMDPLAEFTAIELEQVGGKLQTQFGVTLGALMTLRF